MMINKIELYLYKNKTLCKHIMFGLIRSLFFSEKDTLSGEKINSENMLGNKSLDTNDDNITGNDFSITCNEIDNEKNRELDYENISVRTDIQSILYDEMFDDKLILLIKKHHIKIIQILLDIVISKIYKNIYFPLHLYQILIKINKLFIII